MVIVGDIVIRSDEIKVNVMLYIVIDFNTTKGTMV